MVSQFSISVLIPQRKLNFKLFEVFCFLAGPGLMLFKDSIFYVRLIFFSRFIKIRKFISIHLD